MEKHKDKKTKNTKSTIYYRSMETVKRWIVDKGDVKEVQVYDPPKRFIGYINGRYWEE
jgi:hypothetical protein